MYVFTNKTLNLNLNTKNQKIKKLSVTHLPCFFLLGFWSKKNRPMLADVLADVKLPVEIALRKKSYL
jgi:hypothetical protein